MSKHDVPEAYGMFKPVGHVVISFPTDADSRFAQAALAEAGFHGPETVMSYTPAAMIAQIDAQLADASPLASLGQELNLFVIDPLVGSGMVLWKPKGATIRLVLE